MKVFGGPNFPKIPFHAPKHSTIPLTTQIRLHTPQQAIKNGTLPKWRIEENSLIIVLELVHLVKWKIFPNILSFLS